MLLVVSLFLKFENGIVIYRTKYLHDSIENNIRGSFVLRFSLLLLLLFSVSNTLDKQHTKVKDDDGLETVVQIAV